MPKAGRYDYPSRTLDDCIGYLKKANDVTKEHSMKRDVFAEANKLSYKAGSFGLLIGSMAMYGLVETGSGLVRYTDVAKSILHGEPNEIQDAKNAAVRKVQLFADIYDKLGANFTDEQLRIFLREKAVVDISEANSLAVEVGKLLKRDLQYLKPIATTATSGGGEKQMMQESQEASPSIMTENFKLGEGLEIKLPKENKIDAWNRAKRAMDLLLGVEENRTES